MSCILFSTASDGSFYVTSSPDCDIVDLETRTSDHDYLTTALLVFINEGLTGHDLANRIHQFLVAKKGGSL